MAYNLFYKNNIVNNAMMQNKFLISCEKDNNHDFQFISENSS
jgi:hypothetical protein